MKVKSFFDKLIENKKHRVAAYILLTLLLPCLGVGVLSGSRKAFSETGVIEYSQLGILAIAALAMIREAITRKCRRLVSMLLTAAFLVAFFREMDAFLDDLIPVMGWKLPAGFIFAAAIGLFLKDKVKSSRELQNFAGEGSFYVFLLGLIIVAGFAQLLGWQILLKPLLSGDYERTIKITLEEGTEIIGYFVLLLGCIEYSIEQKYLSEPEQQSQRNCNIRRDIIFRYLHF